MLFIRCIIDHLKIIDYLIFVILIIKTVILMMLPLMDNCQPIQAAVAASSYRQNVYCFFSFFIDLFRSVPVSRV